MNQKETKINSTPTDSQNLIKRTKKYFEMWHDIPLLNNLRIYVKLILLRDRKFLPGASWTMWTTLPQKER
jgi:hypothetical protein